MKDFKNKIISYFLDILEKYISYIAKLANDYYDHYYKEEYQMLCYKDITFCNFYKECKEEDCVITMTDEVVKKAKDFGLPICHYADKPECFKSKEEICTK